MRGPDREVVGGLLAARLASPTHIPRITLVEIVRGIEKNQATLNASGILYLSTPVNSSSRIRLLEIMDARVKQTIYYRER